MTGPEQRHSAAGSPNSSGGTQSPLDATEALSEPHATAGAAWSDAHAYAVGLGVSDPEAFADDYASMIDEARHETRYPDIPLPIPAEFVWP